MKRKELTKTFMMISNWKKHFDLLWKIISTLQRSRDIIAAHIILPWNTDKSMFWFFLFGREHIWTVLQNVTPIALLQWSTTVISIVI